MNPKNKISISKKNLGFATDPRQPSKSDFRINFKPSQMSKFKDILQGITKKKIMIKENQNKDDSL